MKLGESIKFVQFYDRIKDEQMPILTAYKLLKIYKQAKEDESFYYSKVREILNKYGQLDEQGNLIPIANGTGVKLKEGVEADCAKELNELMEVESTIEFEPINLALFKELSLTPSDIENVISFLA